MSQACSGAEGAKQDGVYETGCSSDKRGLAADPSGSIAVVADASGAALQINTYDAFGLPGPNNLGRFQYTGQARQFEFGRPAAPSARVDRTATPT